MVFCGVYAALSSLLAAVEGLWLGLFITRMVLKWQTERGRLLLWHCNVSIGGKCARISVGAGVCLLMICIYVRTSTEMHYAPYCMSFSVACKSLWAKVYTKLYRGNSFIHLSNYTPHLTFKGEEIAAWFWLIVDFKALHKASVDILFSQQRALRSSLVWAGILNAFSHRQSLSDAL